MAAATAPLVIFDCDGVLVDSEPISLDVLVLSLQEAGVGIETDSARSLFLGRSLAAVIDTARESYGVELGDTFLSGMRAMLYRRLREELRAIDGIVATLTALDDHGIAWCVASSSQIERIELSLTVAGIIPRFHPPVFSSSMVEHGKPAPDLFLLAARELGREPRTCIVIEDSPAGIRAAKAAGMRVFAFTGGSHARDEAHRGAIATLGADATFDAMGDLLHLVLQNEHRDGNTP